MTKVSECCGRAITSGKRRGKVYLICSKCHQNTTVQKRIVTRGVWKDPHKGK
jgi:hypothetical protein